MKRPNKKDYDLSMTNEAISYAWDLGEYADYLEEQIKQGQLLPIDSVSQQRELLLAFFDLADELPMGLSHYDREKIVEEFLANNCG